MKKQILLWILVALFSTNLYAQNKFGFHANMTGDINFLSGIGDVSSAFTIGTADDYTTPYAPNTTLGLGIGIDAGIFSIDLRADVGVGDYNNGTITNEKQDYTAYLSLGVECWSNEQTAVDVAAGIGFATSQLYVANRDLNVSKAIQSSTLIVPISATYWVYQHKNMGCGIRLNYTIPCGKIRDNEFIGLSNAGIDLSKIKLNIGTLGFGVIFQI